MLCGLRRQSLQLVCGMKYVAYSACRASFNGQGAANDVAVPSTTRCPGTVLVYAGAGCFESAMHLRSGGSSLNQILLPTDVFQLLDPPTHVPGMPGFFVCPS